MREMKKEKAEARDYHGRGWGPGSTWREADGAGFAFLAGICFSAKPNNVTSLNFVCILFAISYVFNTPSIIMLSFSCKNVWW